MTSKKCCNSNTNHNSSSNNNNNTPVTIKQNQNSDHQEIVSKKKSKIKSTMPTTDTISPIKSNLDTLVSSFQNFTNPLMYHLNQPNGFLKPENTSPSQQLQYQHQQITPAQLPSHANYLNSTDDLFRRTLAASLVAQHQQKQYSNQLVAISTAATKLTFKHVRHIVQYNRKSNANVA